MEYPVYKDKRKPFMKKLFIIHLMSLVLCLVLPWFIYVHGSFTFLFLAYFTVKKYRGFKALFALFSSVLVMLLMFDMADFKLTWSLSYVFPSFIIAITSLMFLIILVRKKKWHQYYSMHSYLIMVNLLVGLLMILGFMQSIVLGIVTLSIFAASLIAIWIRVGKKYYRNLFRFIHV